VNFYQFSMTFPWLSRKIYFSRIFNDFPWPWEPCTLDYYRQKPKLCLENSTGRGSCVII